MFGDVIAEKVSEDSILVEILGTVSSREELDQKLAGWEGAMSGENTLLWVRERLADGAPA